ncbi:hypothetical protein V493_00236 [Pseudogymnoascus sp. VKM F-4281 (FW-2241)]|nr:hypothetical protein V493_00236 [Pseudogymnoascus sp. VKM F-4281 (FW-2241)]
MLLFSLLLAPALFRVSAAEKPFQCPVDDIVRTKCMGPNDCLYPHPTRCNLYIRCEVNDDGRNGRATVKQCPATLEWSTYAKKCDIPKKDSPCAEGGNADMPVNDIPNGASDILSRGDHVENKARDAAPFQCPMKDMLLTQCRGEKDCVYPNPGSCNTYVRCSVGYNLLSGGTPSVKNCSPGHEWNDKDKVCDVPEKSTCPVYANVTTPVADKVEAAESRGIADFKCPVEDIRRTGCKHQGDCQYADPESCSSFYNCIANSDGLTGTPYLHQCPEGNHWNDKVKVCDWPQSANCKQAAKSRGVADFKCPVEDIRRTGCKHQGDCQYADPESCSSFYNCIANSDGLTGTPYLHQCPEGNHWNDKVKVCDWPQSANCKQAAKSRGVADFKCPVEDIRRTGCKHQGDCQYANPESCSSFYNCIANSDGLTGTPYLHQCPEGNHWNDKVKVCDWPQSANCKL